MTKFFTLLKISQNEMCRSALALALVAIAGATRLEDTTAYKACIAKPATCATM